MIGMRLQPKLNQSLMPKAETKAPTSMRNIVPGPMIVLPFRKKNVTLYLIFSLETLELFGQ